MGSIKDSITSGDKVLYSYDKSRGLKYNAYLKERAILTRKGYVLDTPKSKEEIEEYYAFAKDMGMTHISRTFAHKDISLSDRQAESIQKTIKSLKIENTQFKKYAKMLKADFTTENIIQTYQNKKDIKLSRKQAEKIKETINSLRIGSKKYTQLTAIFDKGATIKGILSTDIATKSKEIEIDPEVFEDFLTKNKLSQADIKSEKQEGFLKMWFQYGSREDAEEFYGY